MSSKNKKKQLEDSSDSSDSGPSDRNPPPSKKSRPEQKKAASSNNSDSDHMFQLSKMRYVTVREFRGKVMVDIREFYNSDGDLKPGKKGICLSVEQWNALKERVDEIDDAIKTF